MRMNLSLLKSPLFLLGLGLLLLNDHVLKGLWANALTGKLSDVAGLFVFPLFLTALWPKGKRLHYGFTALLFLWWNSAWSAGFLVWANGWGLGLGRTIDPTDALALLVLPVSYYYAGHYMGYYMRHYMGHCAGKGRVLWPKSSFWPAAGIATLSLVAFVATTMPLAFMWHSTVTFENTREALLFAEIEALDLTVYNKRLGNPGAGEDGVVFYSDLFPTDSLYQGYITEGLNTWNYDTLWVDFAIVPDSAVAGRVHLHLYGQAMVPTHATLLPFRSRRLSKRKVEQLVVKPLQAKLGQ